ncbi:hypothetical protein GOBAR_DD22709 [Gossypium barbadense]|nr:hypothetical protein GOBAR_DD22709 [Gossypium barbadense]
MIKLLSSIKHVAKSSPFLLLKNRNGNSCSYSCLFISPSAIDSPSAHRLNLSAKDVVASLKDWFKAPNTSLLDRIFSILSSQDQAARDDESSRHAADLALSHLNLHLSETFVLQVLSYGRSSSKDVLSCLKFFDWAGRQPGFHHTRATFHAIFKILSKAKLVPLMLEEIRMRFQGLDLDTFAYHVLLNALVDESCFDAVDMIAKQISLRGFDNGITHCILVKCWCKQSKLEEAEAYLRGLAESRKPVDGHAVSIIVSALCKGNRFQHAATLLEEFTELNVPMEQAYGIWLQNVVQRGKLNWYLNFINRKKLFSRNVPRLFQYNVLVLRLLREYRLNDVFDLLIEMENDGISPDKVTMNAVLCFFCKAGMVDVAIELYNSRSEFGLSLNRMTYSDLINNLCWNGVIDEAYCVLRNSVREGYFPSKKTFSILAGALCREEKFDRIKELVVSSLEQKFRPCYDVCDSFIVALCKANRVEDAYLLHGEISRINKDMSSKTYFHLIHGFCKSNRGDIAAALLLEMQEKGHKPTRKLFRYVICCLCDMQNLENQFFKLLEMQLSHFEPSSHIFNFFIAGAGHAKKPELAREISIVVGLCKADKVDYALNFMREMRNNNVFPGMECYEHLIQLFCWKESYSLATKKLYKAWVQFREGQDETSDISLLGQLIGIFSGCMEANQDIKSFEEIIAKCFPVDVYTYNTLLRKLSESKVDLAFELYDWICEKGYEPNRWTYDIIIHCLLKKGRRAEAQRWLEEMFEKGFDLTERTKLLI